MWQTWSCMIKLKKPNGIEYKAVTKVALPTIFERAVLQPIAGFESPVLSWCFLLCDAKP